MKSENQLWKRIAVCMAAFLLCGISFARMPEGDDPDSLSVYVKSLLGSEGVIHRLAAETHPSYVVPTHGFLKGENPYRKLIRGGHSGHLKYSFQFHPNTIVDRIYAGAYQGIGLGFFSFGEKEYLGDPWALYIFQGARMARFSPRLSLNYEWNLGLSFGWKPFDYNTNYDNRVIGSKVNAYMNTNFYFNWVVSRNIDLNAGVSLSHFSNGNTKFPNAGLNTVGFKVGVVYNINRQEDDLRASLFQPALPKFSKHISYDVVLFGSWRRKGIVYASGEGAVASPEAYTVFGFNFTPMYNLGYRFRVGVSADGVYDGSANIVMEDNGEYSSYQDFRIPPVGKQMALGFSGRAEYVMPYFTVGVGIGANVLHAGGDLKGFYQVLTLKAEITRNTFIHIGYNLQNFEDPNYLMLGFGIRLHNKYPNFRRR